METQVPSQDPQVLAYPGCKLDALRLIATAFLEGGGGGEDGEGASWPAFPLETIGSPL